MVGMRSPSELNTVILTINFSWRATHRYQLYQSATIRFPGTCNSELYIIISGVYSNVTLNILHAGIMYASTYG